MPSASCGRRTRRPDHRPTRSPSWTLTPWTMTWTTTLLFLRLLVFLRVRLLPRASRCQAPRRSRWTSHRRQASRRSRRRRLQRSRAPRLTTGRSSKTALRRQRAPVRQRLQGRGRGAAGRDQGLPSTSRTCRPRWLTGRPGRSWRPSSHRWACRRPGRTPTWTQVWSFGMSPRLTQM